MKAVSVLRAVVKVTFLLRSFDGSVK